MALTEINSENKSVFSSMLRWQLVATGVVALITLLAFGLHAAISVVAGGLSVAVAAFVASKVAQRSSRNEASAILINMLKAEAIKIILVVILLFVTFKVYKQLVPMALIAGLAASALFSGAALSKSMAKQDVKI